MLYLGARQLQTIRERYNESANKIKQLIDTEQDQFIMCHDEEQLVDYFCKAWALTPIELDETRSQSWELTKYNGVISAPDRERAYQDSVPSKQSGNDTK